MRLASAFAAGLALAAGGAQADSPVPPPVAVVVDGRLTVGNAQLPVFVSQDWSQPLPAIGRVVIIVHGYERNAADYARTVLDFAPADTMVIAPQFLAPEDIAAHQLPGSILRWARERWSSGYPAEGPAPLSAFDAIDALLATVANRTVFPSLSQVVIAGFSAGGQLVQRYATVGRGGLALARANIPLRYVVGSPSSFAYLGDERPLPTAGCPDFNRWRYGFGGDLPPYVAAAAAAQGVPALEHRYVEYDIVYLVGASDNDPNHRLLDKSCAGEVQGPTRLARTQSFFSEMRRRGGGILKQTMRVIDGAAHNAAKVLGSPCGRAALLDEPGCPAEGEKP